MRYNITKTQAKMLLDGKALTHGRIKIQLPEGFEDKDILKKYNDDESFRKEYKIVVDTADNSIHLESR